jgi:hypothetical protein
MAVLVFDGGGLDERDLQERKNGDGGFPSDDSPARELEREWGREMSAWAMGMVLCWV